MRNFISNKLKQKLEIDFHMKILFLEEYQDRNGYTEEDVYNCAFQCGNEIYLGKYNHENIEILCLFHEIGHIQADKENFLGYYPCNIYQESIAWNEGIKLIKRYIKYINCKMNFNDYYSEEFKFIRQCLKSYVNSEYNDLED